MLPKKTMKTIFLFPLSILAVLTMLISAATAQQFALAQAQSSMVMNQTQQQMQVPSFGIGKPVLVHITTGDNKSNYEVHSATMGVDHALAMLRAGKDVSILLDVNGVYIAAKKAGGVLKPINDELKVFLTEGGRVIACDHCIAMAGLKAEDILSGVEIDTHPAMPLMQKIIDRGAVILGY
jgi:predicted peroxiredoxin